LHREPQGTEYPFEQAVLLEAVAAASAVDQFRLQRGQTEIDGPPEQDVDCLERNRSRMQRRQGSQSLEVRARRAGIADAGEITVEVQLAGGGGYLELVHMSVSRFGPAGQCSCWRP